MIVLIYVKDMAVTQLALRCLIVLLLAHLHLGVRHRMPSTTLIFGHFITASPMLGMLHLSATHYPRVRRR